MNSSEEIKQLAQERLEDALILLANRRFDGAFYLAGYSVELTLKAKICKHLDIDNLFATSNMEGVGEIRRVAKVHDFAILFNLCGLGNQLKNAMSLDRQFKNNCSLLFQSDGWNESVRYKTGHKTPSDVTRVINFLTDTQNGLLQWIENN
jgi:hypothetical protein